MVSERCSCKDVQDDLLDALSDAIIEIEYLRGKIRTESQTEETLDKLHDTLKKYGRTL